MRLFIAAFILLFSPLCQAQYKCVVNGRTWYTNTPCTTETRESQRTEEEKTAAEIQADFEREMAAKRAAVARAEIEANDRYKTIVAETKEPIKPAPRSTKAISPSSTGSWSIWHFGILGLVLYAVPALVAFFRNHHQLAAIVVVNLLLGWTFIGWVVALGWSVTAVKKPTVSTSDIPKH